MQEPLNINAIFLFQISHLGFVAWGYFILCKISLHLHHHYCLFAVSLFYAVLFQLTVELKPTPLQKQVSWKQVSL